jgi:signal transduction histidine kinase
LQQLTVRAFTSSPSVLTPSAPSPASPPLSVTRVAAVRGPRRNRLSRDLHDGVGQSLTTLLMEIRVAIDRGFAGRDDLLILEREAENTIKAVRALAYQVRRRSPLANPLEDARQYGERLLAGSSGRLRWTDERTSFRLAHRVATEVAWVVRESITNGVQHGMASTVDVRLSDFQNRIRVTVRDDGHGFETELPRATPEGRGLGLLGNAERMAEVGGIFTVRSRPGEGTMVLLEAPRFLRRRAVEGPNIQAAMPLMMAVGADEVAAIAGI